MSEISEADIAAMRERLSKADSGPWKVYLVEHPLNEAGRKMFPDGVAASALYERAIVQAWNHPQLKAPLPIVGMASSPYRDQTHTVSISEANAQLIAHAPSDLEALLAEREGMKADAALVADHVLRFWTPVPDSFDVVQAATRILKAAGREVPMGPQQRALEALVRARSAPLDPSSAPTDTPKGTFFDLLDEYAEAHRRGQRLRCISLGAKILVEARSPDREAGSGTDFNVHVASPDLWRCDCCHSELVARRSSLVCPRASSHPVPSEGGGE